MTAPYQRLLAATREVALLDATASLLSWDQETAMPSAGVEHRARQLRQLARLRHERATAPELGELLAACESARPTDADTVVNLRELRRGYDRVVRLPAELVAELSETESLAQHAWAEARAAADGRGDFMAFQPWLAKLVGLCRQKAQCLRTDVHGEDWDALAFGFEPGATAHDLQQVFAPLAAELTELVGDLLDNGTPPEERMLAVALPIDAQEGFVREVVGAVGFDFDRGRLDRSAHPFSIGIGPGDTRITTRFADANVLDALGSTLHEAGHGLYEQGLPAQHWGTPRGDAVSLGIHESQSRLWENQVGRSLAFWRWCHPHLHTHFGDAVAGIGVDEAWRCANRVRRDLIRVEADEATYNLHVVVRFELELALFRGELEAAGVPDAWNAAYRRRLGVEVPDAAQGCLQDVHWSCGMFGYFPTYTLGNLYSAQLHARAEQDLGGLDAQLAAGDFAPLLAWLRAHVHAHGKAFSAAELCRRVTGAELSSAPLLDYLRAKLRRVYRLD